MSESQAHPHGLPTLTSSEYQTLVERVIAFEAPKDMERAIERHRCAMENNE